MSVLANSLAGPWDEIPPSVPRDLSTDQIYLVVLDQGSGARDTFVAESTRRGLESAAQSQQKPGLLEDYFAWVYSTGPKAQSSDQTESAEMAWLTDNGRQLEQFKGEWLLIEGDRLVAHDPQFREIKETIRRLSIRSPFVYYVPFDADVDFVK
jgi:Family of unknown function (DUF5678)